MKALQALWNKDKLLVIGLMSGTSADGMDAALTEITGFGPGSRVRMLGFVSLPYPDEVRSEILRLASGGAGGSRDLCLVGSHGQTLWHIPAPESYLGRPVRGTLQLGEASVIAEGLSCPVVSDFRVRDLAAGGQGAPLVPYAEYLIYRRDDQTVGLQNIGGIGNLTVLPRGGAMGDTFAFDTGPGNMVMDQIVERMTGGRRRYDENGAMAAGGACSGELLAWMMNDPYLMKKPPKSTGREVYGAAYVDALMRKGAEAGLRGEDILATAARFTAECVRVAVQTYCRVRPDILVVGGGGSRNPTLMALLRDALSPMPVLTNEDLGYDSDAKEAVAFAVLANECVHGHVNSMPSVTGARHPVVMGKISL